MSPALAGSASVVQSSPSDRSALRPSLHTIGLFSSECSPCHNPQMNTALLRTARDTPLYCRWRMARRPQVTSPVPRGAGHQQPITGRGVPARPGPGLVPGATRPHWPAGPPRDPAGNSAAAAAQQSVATAAISGCAVI